MTAQTHQNVESRATSPARGYLPSALPPALEGCPQELRLTDYRDLAVRAHLQLGAPIVLVWDNLNTHRQLECASTPPTTTGSPSSSSPVTHHVAFTDPDHLTRTLRRALSQIQHRPDLIDGCLTETGLTITPNLTLIRKAQYP
jgi:hypothetical protein